MEVRESTRHIIENPVIGITILCSDSDSTDTDSDDGVPNVAGIWTTILGADVPPAEFPFTANAGPIHAPMASARPIEYVKMFFTMHFMNAIATQTNLYAQQWVDSHANFLRVHTRSRVHQWIKLGGTSADELYAFLAIIVNMGLNRKPNIEAYWESSRSSQKMPWFPEHMSRDRFTILLKFLHFADNARPPGPDEQDMKIHKIKMVVDHLNRVFKSHYVPDREISIDESLVGYLGKTPHLRQYMPNKHHSRFGVKLWCLCESSTGYTSDIEIYQGSRNHPPTQYGATYDLIIRLLTASDCFNQGYHCVMDNFFSSPKLFLDLFSQHVHCTGTVRANRKGLPKALVKSTLANKEVCERRKGPLLAVAYKDGGKKPLLLSTHAHGGFVNVRTARRTAVQKKPHVVVEYNQHMGGVDLSDMR